MVSRDFALAFAVPLAFAVAGASVGCSSKSEKKAVCDGAADRSACLTTHYLSGYTPVPFPLCKGASTAKIDGTKHIEFLVGEGVDDLEVQTAGRRLQRYYEAYALKFKVQELPGSVAFKYVLSGTEEAMRKRASELGVDASKEPTTDAEALTIERIVGEVLGKNIREVVKRGKTGDPNRIDIVVSDGVVDPAVQKLVAGTSVVLGMGLSPSLFRSVAADAASVNYFEIYDLPPDFTPVFFIGQDDVRRLTPLLGDSIMAHELGHAMGLLHVEEQSNLMYPSAGAVTCLPGLDDKQVAQLAGITRPGSAATTTQSLLLGSVPLVQQQRDAKEELPAFVRLIKTYAKALPQKLRAIEAQRAR